MSIEKMQLVNIVGMKKDLDKTLLKCCESNCFHIENANKTVSSAEGFAQLNEQNPYKEILKQLASIQSLTGMNYQQSLSPCENLDNDEEVENRLKVIETEFSELKDELKKLKDNIFQHEQALIQMNHLQGMNIDVKRLFECEYIKIRFGKLPCDSFMKLSYYSDKTFVFIPYDQDKDYCWGVYFAPSTNINVIDDIMKSLYYERIWVPDFVEGTPKEEISNIEQDLKISKVELEKLEEKFEKKISVEAPLLNEIFTKYKLLHDNFELRTHTSVLNDNFYLVGFIPQKSSKKFVSLFNSLPGVSVVVKPAEADIRLTPPVKLRNRRFAKPFSMFIEMYGLPSYNGFNPTSLVAITYTIMFGIMFGDLGQGLLISLIGLILNKKTKNALSQILIRVGLSSAFFGLIYGSVFGFEELLDPLYHAIGLKHKPLEVMVDTNIVLAGAICIGVMLIIISIVLNIVVCFKQKKYGDAIFGNNGIVGLVFFGSILTALVFTLLLGYNLFTPVYIIFLIVLPLILMFFREPLGDLAAGKKIKIHNMGDFLASNFFEVFEFLLGYATNTLSFIRIGGFVLSHAGMMAVVMLLSESAGIASPLVIIIGNLFVIGMEGMLVGIQVLRLEFYEIFSRFYEGDGHAFEPVGVKYDSLND